MLSTHFDDAEDEAEAEDDECQFCRIDGGFCGQLFSKGKVARVSKTDEAQGGSGFTLCRYNIYIYIFTNTLYPNVDTGVKIG